ncbi:MAG: ABC transporter permease subunit [Lachnospiraceae bacterium]|nr:ABC transporter permease subunit [Lachnospiraceae bacterium]
MLNYIRSELYRNFHQKGSYLLIGVCGGLLVAMHVLLGVVEAQAQGSFNYGNLSFTFTMLLGAGPLLVAVALVAGSVAFGEEYKNGTMKNTVAYGFSRVKIFFGKQIAALITAMICFLAIIAIFLVSGLIFLQNASAAEYQELLTGMIAIIPNLMGVLALTVSLHLIMESGAGAQWIGLGIVFVLPPVFELLGIKFPIFAELLNWIPSQAIGNVMTETGYVWDTAEGMLHCVSVGAIWLAFSLGFGCIGFARKEIK